MKDSEADNFGLKSNAARWLGERENAAKLPREERLHTPSQPRSPAASLPYDKGKKR